MELSTNAPDKTDEEVTNTLASLKQEENNHVSAALVELWRDYKNSHLPNLVYSVAFVGGTLTLGSTSELFKRVSDSGKTLISMAVVLCVAAAGLSMLHRFSSQVFMEIETLPGNTRMIKYFQDRNSNYKKVTFSYGYDLFFVEAFQLGHTVTKFATSILLYFAWVMFGLTLMSAFLKPFDCNNEGRRILGDGKTEPCVRTRGEYADFVEWFVSWLANDFYFASVLVLCLMLMSLCIALSLKKPGAMKNNIDNYGPVSWLILLSSVSLCFALFFCWLYNLTLLTVDVSRRPILSIALFSGLVVIGLLSWKSLKARRRNFKEADSRIQFLDVN